MREKHLALIRILVNREEWMTAKQLSLQLHISERSVKNYIGEINYFETNKDNINTINSEIASIKSKNSEQDSSISSINSEISSIKSRLDALEAK